MLKHAFLKLIENLSVTHTADKLLKEFAASPFVKIRNDTDDISITLFDLFLKQKGLQRDEVISDSFLNRSSKIAEFFAHWLKLEKRYTYAPEQKPEKSGKINQLSRSVLNLTTSFLDTPSNAAFSSSCFRFYQARRDPVSQVEWEKRFIALGVNPLLMMTVLHYNVIKWPQNLYAALIHFSEKDLAKLQFPWEILFLSGEPTAMHFAVKNLGVNKHTHNDELETPLHLAGANGSLSGMHFALETVGVPAHVKTKSQCNVLMYIARSNHELAIRTGPKLLKLDPRTTDENNSTPLHHSALAGGTNGMRLIAQEWKCDTQARNKFAGTILHFAALSRNAATIDIAIDEFKLDPQAVDCDGETALHHAVTVGCVPVLKNLLRRGLNPHQRDDDKQSPMKHAMWHKKQQALRTALYELSKEEKEPTLPTQLDKLYPLVRKS